MHRKGVVVHHSLCGLEAGNALRPTTKEECCDASRLVSDALLTKGE
jgi:hypothetical protein